MLDSVRDARRALGRHTREVRARIHAERVAAADEAITGKAGVTPETRAKLRPDPLFVLLREGVIDDGGARDLHQIARGYQLTTMDVSLRLASYERVDGSLRDTALKPDDLDAIKLFAAWWPALKDAGLQQAWTAVIDLCVDGMSLRAIDEVRAWRHGTARERVLEGLACYRAVKRAKR
jgi:glycine/D-amino acid oxidase-like deaminating enzyme